MTTNLGFGKTQPQPKESKRAAVRVEAAKQYDKMKADGIPEFEVYIRIKDKKAWYPVGAIAVKRSSLIDRAIFDNEADLLQGAFRLFPVLRKHQAQLEYGYRLKQFKDEPIQVAVPPQAKGSPIIQGAIANLSNRFGALLKRE